MILCLSPRPQAHNITVFYSTSFFLIKYQRTIGSEQPAKLQSSIWKHM